MNVGWQHWKDNDVITHGPEDVAKGKYIKKMDKNFDQNPILDQIQSVPPKSAKPRDRSLFGSMLLNFHNICMLCGEGLIPKNEDVVYCTRKACKRGMHVGCVLACCSTTTRPNSASTTTACTPSRHVYRTDTEMCGLCHLFVGEIVHLERRVKRNEPCEDPFSAVQIVESQWHTRPNTSKTAEPLRGITTQMLKSLRIHIPTPKGVVVQAESYIWRVSAEAVKKRCKQLGLDGCSFRFSAVGFFEARLAAIVRFNQIVQEAHAEGDGSLDLFNFPAPDAASWNSQSARELSLVARIQRRYGWPHSAQFVENQMKHQLSETSLPKDSETQSLSELPSWIRYRAEEDKAHIRFPPAPILYLSEGLRSSSTGKATPSGRKCSKKRIVFPDVTTIALNRDDLFSMSNSSTPRLAANFDCPKTSDFYAPVNNLSCATLAPRLLNSFAFPNIRYTYQCVIPPSYSSSNELLLQPEPSFQQQEGTQQQQQFGSFSQRMEPASQSKPTSLLYFAGQNQKLVHCMSDASGSTVSSPSSIAGKRKIRNLKENDEAIQSLSTIRQSCAYVDNLPNDVIPRAPKVYPSLPPTRDSIDVGTSGPKYDPLHYERGKSNVHRLSETGPTDSWSSSGLSIVESGSHFSQPVFEDVMSTADDILGEQERDALDSRSGSPSLSIKDHQEGAGIITSVMDSEIIDGKPGSLWRSDSQKFSIEGASEEIQGHMFENHHQTPVSSSDNQDFESDSFEDEQEDIIEGISDGFSDITPLKPIIRLDSEYLDITRHSAEQSSTSDSNSRTSSISYSNWSDCLLTQPHCEMTTLNKHGSPTKSERAKNQQRDTRGRFLPKDKAPAGRLHKSKLKKNRSSWVRKKPKKKLNHRNNKDDYKNGYLSDIVIQLPSSTYPDHMKNQLERKRKLRNHSDFQHNALAHQQHSIEPTMMSLKKQKGLNQSNDSEFFKDRKSFQCSITNGKDIMITDSPLTYVLE